jgi:signal transduction histidine kinase/DNA-binding response OmpR family regulator
VLYLAHDGVAGAFTNNRVGVVRVLAAQAAVALENATLYDQLESKVRERTAELIVARRRAEVASQAKSEFLGNMSHELRTPLNAILGYAQIVLRGDDLRTAQRDALQTIYDAGQHLLSLINDVLDMARIEAGRLGLDLVPVDLPALARGVVEVLELQARRKGLVLGCHVGDGVPRWVEADPRRLRQVLLNLLGNAVKFTPKGSVTLRVRRGDDGVGFEVSDTGVGIAEDELEAIFDPFEQVGEASQRAQGTGLGLAITRQLVDAMGGSIEVRSTVGQGSTFAFTLPLRTAAQPKGEARARITGYEGPRRRVLVVDDGRLNRLVLLDMLEPLGFEVLLAADGDEGLRAADDLPPDLVLMDLVMPGRDGFETTRLLKESHPRVPVVSVSASVRPAVADDPLFEAALGKPVELDELLATVERALGVVWVRQEEVPSALPDVVGADLPDDPPRVEVVETWRELALSGDLAGLARAVRQHGEAHPEHQVLVDRITALVDLFDDEGAIELLDELRR